MRDTPSSGYTIIELIMVIIIIMTVTSLGISRYSKFSQRETLRQAALTFKTDVHLLQSKSMSGVKPIQGACTSLLGYSLSFTATSYSYAPSCTPVEDEPELVTRELPVGVQFSPVPQDILFRVLNEGINSTQNIIINMINTTESYRLSIQPNGVITDYKFQ